MLACQSGTLDGVKALINAGANRSLRDITGRNTLHFAVGNRNNSSSSILIELMQRIKKPSNHNDGSEGVIVDDRNEIYSSHLFESRGGLRMHSDIPDINARDQDGANPLYVAVASGNIPCIRILIKLGTLITFDAFLCAVLKNDVDIVSLLLKSSPSNLVNETDQYGRTALAWASYKGHAEVMKMLLEYGADMNIKDKKGRMALHYTCEAQFLKCTEILLSNDSTLTEVMDLGGDTPLSLAKRNVRFMQLFQRTFRIRLWKKFQWAGMACVLCGISFYLWKRFRK